MERFSQVSLRNKLLFFFLVFTSIPILAFSYWTLQTLDKLSEEAVLESLHGLAKTKTQALETFSLNRLRNIDKLSSLSDIVVNTEIIVSGMEVMTQGDPPQDLPALEKEGGGVPQSVAEKRHEEQDKVGKPKVTENKFSQAEKIGPNANPVLLEARRSLRKTINVMLSDQREYEEILIINPEGLVIASTFDGHEKKTAKGIDYFENGLKTTYFQHVFVSSITEKLTMVISTPIKNETGDVLGVFAARLNLDLFFNLVEDLSGLKKTGETIVAKEIDGDAVFMAPTRHDYNAALARNVKIGSDDMKPLQEAVRGGRGAGPVVDYRGVHCLAAWENVPSLGWGLMVKVDHDEAVQPYVETQQRTIFLTLFILCVGLILSYYIANALVRPIKILQEAADRISKGDLDVKIAIYSRDEIGDLANSFGRMIASIKFLMEEKDRR